MLPIWKSVILPAKLPTRIYARYKRGEIIIEPAVKVIWLIIANWVAEQLPKKNWE